MDIKRGDIYYADLTPVVGSEQDGIRPVLCIQNNTGNKFSTTTIIAPITSRTVKNNLPTHVPISTEGLMEHSYVLLEQIRTIDKIRFREYVGKISSEDMGRVDHAIVVSMGLKYTEVSL